MSQFRTTVGLFLVPTTATFRDLIPSVRQDQQVARPRRLLAARRQTVP